MKCFHLHRSSVFFPQLWELASARFLYLLLWLLISILQSGPLRISHSVLPILMEGFFVPLPRTGQRTSERNAQVGPVLSSPQV